MVAWLLPAVARTAATGNGHWARPSSGSVSGTPEALALGLALELGDALLLGGEFAVARTVGDAVGDGRLEMEALALDSGDPMTLGSADAGSSVVDELDGSITIERDSSDADCEELGDGSSIVDGDADGVADTVDDDDALALTLGVPDALAEGSITG